MYVHITAVVIQMLKQSLFQAVRQLDEAPQEVIDHVKKTQDEERMRQVIKKMKWVEILQYFLLFLFSWLWTKLELVNYLRRNFHVDKHSLQGKHGKTHGIC